MGGESIRSSGGVCVDLLEKSENTGAVRLTIECSCRVRPPRPQHAPRQKGLRASRMGGQKRAQFEPDMALLQLQPGL